VQGESAVRRPDNGERGAGGRPVVDDRALAGRRVAVGGAVRPNEDRPGEDAGSETASVTACIEKLLWSGNSYSTWVESPLIWNR